MATAGAADRRAWSVDDGGAPDIMPSLFGYASASAPPRLVSQGAEARLYRASFLEPGLACALKFRPPKRYRHEALDRRLTRQRILAEARILVRCRREQVPVPAVLGLDEAAGWIAMEWIEGECVKAVLDRWLGADGGEGPGPPSDADGSLVGLMQRVGRLIGRLHRVGVVHGDLTTSNMMLQRENGSRTASPAAGRDADLALLRGPLVLIDFGLASQGIQDEDRAVDLYVLERALSSTHPKVEPFFGEVLLAYRSTFDHAPEVIRRLDEVRTRGRKRSMVG